MDSERERILDEAKLAVLRDRNTDYGEPERNFEIIAALWSQYKSEPFTAHDVAAMLILLKVARLKTSPERADHWVDIAGYAACGAEVVPVVRP